MTNSLTARDLLRLQGVHPDLVKVVQAAVPKFFQSANPARSFFVIEGLRTKEQEAVNVANGKSQTMDSRHLFGLAVDLGIMLNGVLVWDVPSYEALADVMLSCAATLNVPIIYGGSWQTLKDYDHFELSRAFYPDNW